MKSSEWSPGLCWFTQPWHCCVLLLIPGPEDMRPYLWDPRICPRELLQEAIRPLFGSSRAVKLGQGWDIVIYVPHKLTSPSYKPHCITWCFLGKCLQALRKKTLCPEPSEGWVLHERKDSSPPPSSQHLAPQQPLKNSAQFPLHDTPLLCLLYPSRCSLQTSQ